MPRTIKYRDRRAPCDPRSHRLRAITAQPRRRRRTRHRRIGDHRLRGL